MARKIGLGMPRREVLKVLAEGDVNEKKTSNYIGRIWSKGGAFDTIVSSPHTADFVVPDDGSEWTLASVKIVKVNAVTINGGAVAEENIHLYPFFAVIDDADNLMFHFSSGSVIGVDEIKYNITCECTVSMKPESYRLITQKLSERVTSLETGAGGSVDEEKVEEIVDQRLGHLQIQENITNLQDNVGEHENRLDEQNARILAIEGEDFANQGYVDQEIRYAIVEEKHSGLETTNKTIVGAINEINAKESGGSGLVIGETEGTAYDGGKGFAVAADVAQLKIDVENLAGNLEGAVSTVNPMLENHESRISALESGGGSSGGGSSSGGGDCDCYGEPSIVLSLFMYDSVTFKNLTGVTRIDWGDGTIDDYATTPTTFTHTYEKYDMDLFYEVKIYGCTAIGDNAFWNVGSGEVVGAISNITIDGEVKSIGKNAIGALSTTGYHPSGEASIVFTSDVPPKIANVKYMNRDENWEYFGEGDFPAEQTSYSSFSSEITKIAIPTSAGLDAYSRYWMSLYDSILEPIVKMGSEGGFTPDQEMTINAIADMAAMNAIEYSATIGEIKDRVTALEEGGGGGGTKLYKIIGNAYEGQTNDGLTFNFQAIGTKDPSLLTVFDEIMDSFGLVSIMPMPNSSGFYPIGFVKRDGYWHIYGLKDGAVVTSNFGLMGSWSLEEL